MSASKSIIFIFVLVAVLADTLCHANHQYQIRTRRQADAAPEEEAHKNTELEDAVQENHPPEDNQATDEQGPTTENQEQEDANVDNTLIDLGFPFWTTCNYTIDPIKSCYDCNRLIICKRIGGLVKRCGNPFRPHCNNGTCSPIPSAECADLD